MTRREAPRPRGARTRGSAERVHADVLVPMTKADFEEFLDDVVPGYAADKVAAGQWAQDTAMEMSRAALLELLPLGLATPDHQLFTIRDRDGVTKVGNLWIALQMRAGRRIAYVYDVAINPEHRRAGHAKRAFVALEDKVRSLGLAGIALHVFGHNAGAHALYVKLGYAATNIDMFKPIAPVAG